MSKSVAFLGSMMLGAALLGGTAATAAPNGDSTDVSVSLPTPEPLPSPTSDPLAAANTHIARHAQEWGISPSNLKVGRLSQGIAGMTTVRYSQKINGLEVLGSLVALTVSESGSLLSYTIKVGNAPDFFTSASTKKSAATAAASSLAAAQNLHPSDLQILSTTLSIADPNIVEFVTGSSQLVWVVRLQQKLAPISITTIYLEDSSLATLYSSSGLRHVTNDPAPLVCDLQLMDNSYAAVGESRSLVRASASMSISTRKAKSGEKKLRGLSSSRLWLVAMTSYAGGVSTAYRSIKIPKSGIATYSINFAHVPTTARYSLFVGTGSTKPTQSKMIRIQSGLVKSRISGKVQGFLPKTGTKLTTALLTNGKVVSFLSLSGDTLPLCNYNNAGITKTSTNSTSRIERSNAKTYITQTQQYFSSVLGIDIFSETYLGNISPKLNYGTIAQCGTGQSASSEAGNCTPRVSAFTNVCVYQSNNLSCPEFSNAFWTPWASTDCRSQYCSAIFMGRGFVADDVIAHELAHGVSGYEAFNATMSNDAESLSEAYSDFFGEAFDQLTTRTGEVADPNWGMGEDVTGSTPGPFREMRGSDRYGVPYYGGGCWVANGDEHNNNGPANRFAWLISNGNGGDNSDVDASCLPNDGGIVRSIPVTAIGTHPTNGLCDSNGSNCTAIKNMNRLVFAALSHLTSAATYSDFGREITSACLTLSQANGWVDGAHPGYCSEVEQALTATGIPHN